MIFYAKFDKSKNDLTNLFKTLKNSFDNMKTKDLILFAKVNSTYI